ncbi:uncharacterized protein LOC113796731 [Dermatophagoides pteronyssinus]|uniref:uncharacterized protein LOC113796731 n=1 Tax=Dermatophagoides pteronyssinus TaxID=6956 RepID=UPI003F67B455
MADNSRPVEKSNVTNHNRNHRQNNMNRPRNTANQRTRSNENQSFSTRTFHNQKHKEDISQQPGPSTDNQNIIDDQRRTDRHENGQSGDKQQYAGFRRENPKQHVDQNNKNDKRHTDRREKGQSNEEQLGEEIPNQHERFNNNQRRFDRNKHDKQHTDRRENDQSGEEQLHGEIPNQHDRFNSNQRRFDRNKHDKRHTTDRRENNRGDETHQQSNSGKRPFRPNLNQQRHFNSRNNVPRPEDNDRQTTRQEEQGAQNHDQTDGIPNFSTRTFVSNKHRIKPEESIQPQSDRSDNKQRQTGNNRAHQRHPDRRKNVHQSGNDQQDNRSNFQQQPTMQKQEERQLSDIRNSVAESSEQSNEIDQQNGRSNRQQKQTMQKQRHQQLTDVRGTVPESSDLLNEIVQQRIEPVPQQFDLNSLLIRQTEQNSRPLESRQEYLIISRNPSVHDGVFAMLNVAAIHDLRSLNRPCLRFLHMNDPKWAAFLNKGQKISNVVGKLGKQFFVENNLAELSGVEDEDKDFLDGAESIQQLPNHLIECPICRQLINIKQQCIAYTDCLHAMCLDCCITCIGLYKFCPVCRKSIDYLVVSASPLESSHLRNRLLFTFLNTPIGSVAFYDIDQYKIQKLFDSLLFIGCPYSNESCRSFDVLRFQQQDDNYFKSIVELYQHFRTTQCHGNMFICMLCVTTLRISKKYLITYNYGDFLKHFKNENTLHDGTPIKHVQCPLCSRYLFSEDFLWEHCKRDHLSCYLCHSFFTIDQSDMIVHYRQNHCYCSVCDMAFEPFELPAHKSIHPNEDINYRALPESSQSRQLQETTITNRGYIDQIDMELRKEYKIVPYFESTNLPTAGPSVESYLINFPAISSNAAMPMVPKLSSSRKPESWYSDNFPSLSGKASSMAKMMGKSNLSQTKSQNISNKKQPKVHQPKQQRSFSPPPNQEWIPDKKPQIEIRKVTLIDNDKAIPSSSSSTSLETVTKQIQNIAIKQKLENSEEFPPLAISDNSFEQQSKKLPISFTTILQDNERQREDKKRDQLKPRKKPIVNEWPSLDGVSSSPNKKEDEVLPTLFPQPPNKSKLSIGSKKFEKFNNFERRQTELYEYILNIFIENGRYDEFIDKFVSACQLYYWNEIPGIVFIESINKSIGSTSIDKSDIFYRLAAYIPDIDKQKEIMAYIRGQKNIRVDAKKAISSSCKRCGQIFMNEDINEHSCRKKVIKNE